MPIRHLFFSLFSRATEMFQAAQMPFLTCLVFSVGLGVGFAWKSGWIPIELAATPTGQILNEPGSLPADSAVMDPARPLQWAAFAEQSSVDPVVFEQQTEPVEDISSNESAGSQEPKRLRNPATRRLPDTSETDRSSIPQQLSLESSVPDPSKVRVDPEFAVEAIQAEGSLVSEPAEDRDFAAAEGETSQNQTLDAAGSLRSELRSIDAQIEQGETIAAHRELSKSYWNHRESRTDLLSRLDKTSDAIFFQPQPHFTDPYVIQPNDQLRVIAGKYQISWEYLSQLNKIDPRRVQSGQKLKVVKGPFSAIIDLPDYTLTIHLQGYFVKSYQVGIGQRGSSPVGKFSVLGKIENPQYTGPDGKVIAADDPANPLGERWIDLGESYGIHGTIDPDSIGKAASRGCIRMNDQDIVEVYNFLVKGSEVVIRK